MRLPLRWWLVLCLAWVLAAGGLSVAASRTTDSTALRVSTAPAAPRAEPAPAAVLARAPTGPAPTSPPGSGPAPTGPVADPAWVSRVAAATGIPARALQAYATAALVSGVERASCRLGWTTLAAIGAVESDHGRHNGSSLADSGTTTVPIVGPALDGSPGVAAIGDTDDGALDADPTWDRAVGPMQFLPSTWRRWGSSGDPQSVDDASLAASRYLCAAGGDLRTGAAWQAAVLSYNESTEHVQAVLTTANRYASRAAAAR